MTLVTRRPGVKIMTILLLCIQGSAQLNLHNICWSTGFSLCITDPITTAYITQSWQFKVTWFCHLSISSGTTPLMSQTFCQRGVTHFSWCWCLNCHHIREMQCLWCRGLDITRKYNSPTKTLQHRNIWHRVAGVVIPVKHKITVMPCCTGCYRNSLRLCPPIKEQINMQGYDLTSWSHYIQSSSIVALQSWDISQQETQPLAHHTEQQQCKVLQNLKWSFRTPLIVEKKRWV